MLQVGCCWSHIVGGFLEKGGLLPEVYGGVVP